MTAVRRRSNGEGSIFPYRNGFAAYVWVATPAGRRQRKYVYGKTREQVHDKWIRLQGDARRGPIATSSPTVETFLHYWLEQVVEPNLAPLTAATYSTLVRLYILPGLGLKRLDRLQVRDVQAWLTRVRQACQCCEQGKDAARAEDRRRCCAVGKCCHQQISDRTAQCASRHALDRIRMRRRVRLDAGRTPNTRADIVRARPTTASLRRHYGAHDGGVIDRFAGRVYLRKPVAASRTATATRSESLSGARWPRPGSRAIVECAMTLTSSPRNHY